MDDRAQLEQLIQIRTKYLRQLEQQEASFGMYVPPYIRLDLDNTRAEIASLEARLAQLTGQRPSSSGQSGQAGDVRPPVQHAALHRVLTEHYNLEELRTLCFNL